MPNQTRETGTEINRILWAVDAFSENFEIPRQVNRNARCPVLVIHPDHKRDHGNGEPRRSSPVLS